MKKIYSAPVLKKLGLVRVKGVLTGTTVTITEVW